MRKGNSQPYELRVSNSSGTRYCMESLIHSQAHNNRQSAAAEQAIANISQPCLAKQYIFFVEIRRPRISGTKCEALHFKWNNPADFSGGNRQRVMAMQAFGHQGIMPYMKQSAFGRASRDESWQTLIEVKTGSMGNTTGNICRWISSCLVLSELRRHRQFSHSFLL
jgi:hypothetical protein